MPAMLCAWPDVLISVCAADNRDRTNLTGVTGEEGGLPRFEGGGCGWVDAEYAWVAQRPVRYIYIWYN